MMMKRKSFCWRALSVSDREASCVQPGEGREPNYKLKAMAKAKGTKMEVRHGSLLLTIRQSLESFYSP
jgi:hypothetical protein